MSSVNLIERLEPGLQRYVAEEWDDLREIQKEALSPLLEGKDAILEAPTAGGKTEAVLFPVLTRAARAPATGVRVLYLAPLRALLNNLQDRGEEYAGLCGLRGFKWHGDVGQNEKLAALADPPELLMTTPESMEAILLRKAEWQRLFENLLVVIIDEAHNFAAGDRGGHLLSLLERIEGAMKQPFPPQRIALTATIGNPNALLGWLAGKRRKPGIRIHVTAPPKPRDFRVEHFDRERESDATPPQERAEFRRFTSLAHQLPGHRSIVFVPSRAKAESLAKAFTRYRTKGLRSLSVRTHHSNVSRFFREEAESLIQHEGEQGLDAIISTSTLELGIDIGHLDHVAQMDSIASPSSFLQRVGRTGRREGRQQSFRGFTIRERDLPLLVATVSLGLRQESEALDLPTRAFHLLAHQLICMSLQYHGVARDTAWRTLSDAHCFSGIRRTEFDDLVHHMIRTEYLRDADGVLVVADQTEKVFLGAGWRRLFAVFDTAPFYEVLHAKTSVGTLSVGFVEALEVPFFFVLAGKLWKAVKVDSRGHVVHAVPAREGDTPKWEMAWGLDVPFETAQEVGRLLYGKETPSFVNAEGTETIDRLRRQRASVRWTPRSVSIVPQGTSETLVTTYAGDRINRTLARALAMLDTGKTSANYAEIRVKFARETAREGTDRLEAALRDLAHGQWNDASALSTALADRMPQRPFSPFARCLPRSLAAEAMLEGSMDVSGLLLLLRQNFPS